MDRSRELPRGRRETLEGSSPQHLGARVGPWDPVPGLESVPGAGIQFWGPIDQGKAWEAFVQEHRTRQKAGALSARATDKVRRTSERFKLTLEVVLGGRIAVTRDLSETGMAVRTDAPLPVGTRAQMQLRATGHEPMVLDVIVRRVIAEPAFRGLGLEFVDVARPGTF